MRIDKLHLQDFGQFHQKDIALGSGVNVIYGANEAGKSTIKDFIMDMFYGIDKSRGMGARFDHYEKRKPINGAAFSGAMEISNEQGGRYQIERNFSRQEKKTVVRDLDSGRELALLEPNSILGTVLHTDKSTYENTLCIEQKEASIDKSISDKLNNYIVNMSSSRAGDIDAISAIMELKNKKKEFSNKELEEREQDLTSKLSLDRDFDAEMAALKEEYSKLEARMNGKPDEKLQFTPINPNAENDRPEEKREDEREPKTKAEKEMQMLRNMGSKGVLDNVFVILVIGILLVALFVGLAYLIPVNIPELKMGIIGIGLALVLLTVIQVLIKRARLYSMLEEIEIERNFEEAKNGGLSNEDQRDLLNRMSDIRIKEEKLVSERREQEQMMEELTTLREKKEENNREIAALDLAINTIQDLSEEIYDTFGSSLNDKVSELLRKITSNRYTEVKIDDQLRVMVKSGNSYISMEYLSTGTIEQIYLALRLSIAEVLIHEDLPIVIDDIFGTYDNQRLRETLSCLGEYLNRQIIILTANPGIQDIFASLGILTNNIAI